MPAPVAPTMATSSPGVDARSRRRAGPGASASYPKCTSSKVDRARGRRCAPSSRVPSTRSGAVSRISKHALRAGPRALDEAPRLREAVDRRVERGEVAREDQHVADREPPRHHLRRAEPEHGRRPDRDEHVHERRVDGLEGVEAEVRVEARARRVDEAPVLVLLGRERLDDADRADRALRDRPERALLHARVRREGVDPRRTSATMARKQHGHDREGDERHGRVDPQHHDRHAAEQHDRRQDREEAVHRERLDRERVGGEPEQQVADLVAGCETPATAAARCA